MCLFLTFCGRVVPLIALIGWLLPATAKAQSSVPSITSPTTATAIIGTAFTYTISATGTPYQFGATNLPAGFTCDLATGRISGTPTATGNYAITLSATNASGTGTATLNLSVMPPAAPVIGSPASVTGTVGVAFDYSIWATNSPTSYSITTLPAGLWFNSGSGFIGGTPTQAGIFSVTLSATNASGTGSITLTLSIAAGAAPVITSATEARVAAGSIFSYAIVATGNPAPTSFWATGLPAGLEVWAGTGQIVGRPTTPGSYSITLSAENSSGRGTATLQLTVTPPAPVLLGENTVPVPFGAPFSYSITAENAPTSFGAERLPTGLTLNSTTGVISGTVTTTTGSTATLSATNAFGTGTKQVTFAISVPQNSSPGINSPGTATGWVGVAFTYATTTSNSATSFSADRLPPGLSINPFTGVISGVPTLPGVFMGTLTATNASGSNTVSYQVTVHGLPNLQSRTVIGTVGSPFRESIPTVFMPDTTFTVGALPAGLTFNAGGALFEGTPTSAGSFPVAVTATNPAGTTSATLTLVIADGGIPVITSPATATAVFGQPFSYRISGTNTPTYFNIEVPTTARQLNLEVVNSTGEVRAAAVGGSGTFEITIVAENPAGFVRKTLVITIPHALHAVAPPSNNLHRVGQNLRFDVQFSTEVIVRGNPRIPILIGSTTRYATARAEDIPMRQVSFSYQVVAGDQDLDGISLGSSIELNGGAIVTALTAEPLPVALPPTPTPYVAIDTAPRPDAAPVIIAPTALSVAGGGRLTYLVFTGGGLPTSYQVTGAPPLLEWHPASACLEYYPIAGNYTVSFTLTVSNSFGSDSKVITITVSQATTAPAIDSPTSASAIVGAAFSYQITTSATGGTPASYSASGLPAWLTLNPATGRLQGTPDAPGITAFAVNAQNFGGVSTRMVTLTAAIATTPVVIASPESGSFPNGSTLTLRVTALGTAPLLYQWRKNGADIPGATQSTLTFPALQTGDASFYHVTVRNALGTADSQAANVLVSPGAPFTPPRGPSIIGGPSPQSAVEGTNVNLSVNVIGNEPLQYQWRKNGVPLSNANRPTLTLYNVNASDAGDYEVAIVNPYGGVTSPRVPVTVNPIAPATPPPTAGWLSQDIGAVSPAGGSTVSGANVSVRGSGADIWDTTDAFHFRYQNLTGDGEIIARVTELDRTHAWAKAGLMIRESVASNSRNALVFVNPSFVAELQARSNPGGETMPTGGYYLSGPLWLKLARAGNLITASQSRDGVTWTLVQTVTLSLPSTVFIGLAVTSHQPGLICNATFDNIALSGTATATPPPTPAVLAAPSDLVATATSPNDVALTWRDNSTDETSFELQSSTDNINFLAVASAPANATSTTRTGLSAATTYYFRIRALRSGTTSSFSATASAATPAIPLPPPATPSAWTSVDIGEVIAHGYSTDSGGSIAVAASGADIWDSADEFHFRHQSLTGDGDIVVRVVGLSFTHVWAKAGVMFRESLEATSRHAFMCISANAGTAFQNRAVTASSTATAAGGLESVFPAWLRIVRRGNAFTGYESRDGIAWSEVGAITLSLPSTILVGLAVTSHSDGNLTAGTFDNVAINGSTITPPPPATATVPAPTALVLNVMSASAISLGWTDNSSAETGFEIQRSLDRTTFTTVTTTAANITSWADAGLTAATTYSYRIRAVQGPAASAFTGTQTATTFTDTPTPPPPPTTTATTWSSTDIGPVAAVGSSAESGGVVTLMGSGEDIWNAADEFRFRYIALAGDGTIVARLIGLTNTHGWAKAGVMIREQLSASSSHAFMCVSVAHGGAFQRRLTTAGASESTAAAGFQVLPRWVRLVRAGQTITGSESTDGVTWTQVGTITASWTTAYIGLAVTSHEDGLLATATFDNVSLAGIAGTPPPPSTPPPTTALAAPTSLVATASATQVALGWTGQSSAATTFELQRSTDGVVFTALVTLGSSVTSHVDTDVTAGSTYHYRIRAANASGVSPFSLTASSTIPAVAPPGVTWANSDIGATGVAGSITTGVASITVRAAGADIWEGSDAFHFLYQSRNGDCLVEAQVTAISPTHAWAKAGVMIRESLAAGARNAFLFLTPTNGIGLQARTGIGAATTFTPGPWGAAVPYWVRLERTGNTFTASLSQDGITWTVLDRRELAFGSTVLVGFAATSHDNTTLSTATFNEPFIR